MLTLEGLKEYGADTADALERCMDNESFYLTLAGKAIEDEGYEKLKSAIRAKDYEEAFSAAHALKGIVTNLSLTPLARPIVEITEALRAGETDRDYEDLLAVMDGELAKLRAMI